LKRIPSLKKIQVHSMVDVAVDVEVEVKVLASGESG
jgi:hypothetical protein